MTFTVAAPGTIPSPARDPQSPRWKVRRGWTTPGRYEAVEAVSADGRWVAERAQDGTWAVRCVPTETVAKDRLRSLPACRAYVASGKAEADLGHLKAHGRGEHQAKDRKCAKCQAKEEGSDG